VSNDNPILSNPAVPWIAYLCLDGYDDGIRIRDDDHNEAALKAATFSDYVASRPARVGGYKLDDLLREFEDRFAYLKCERCGFMGWMETSDIVDDRIIIGGKVCRECWERVRDEAAADRARGGDPRDFNTGRERR